MMSFAEQKLIIDRHKQTMPVRVVPLANELGISVYTRSDWPDNISGRIFKSSISGGNSGYAIEVNVAHAPTRRRFTIAHEIAHFVLHPNLIGDELFDDGLYRSGLSNRIEAQANQMAQQILMPDHLVESAMMQYGRDPLSLARLFEVSEAAMRIKLGMIA
jgi:Zn-dependent peptidase ImmA (M78 family)